MDPVMEYENSLHAPLDTSSPTTPKTVWPTDPNPFATPRGGWISASEDEEEPMEITASNAPSPLPSSHPMADFPSLPPIITSRVVDSTTIAPTVPLPPCNEEGPSRVVPPVDIKKEVFSPHFFYYGATHWKGLEHALWEMRKEEGMENSILFGKTIGEPPVPALTGEPVEDTVPLLAARAVRTEGRLYGLEKYAQQYEGLEFWMEGHARAIERLNDQVRRLQEEKVEIKEELGEKEKRIVALEEEVKKTNKSLEFYKGLTRDMGVKFIEWDAKMTSTFEAISKAVSMGLDRPSTS